MAALFDDFSIDRVEAGTLAFLLSWRPAFLMRPTSWSAASWPSGEMPCSMKRPGVAEPFQFFGQAPEVAVDALGCRVLFGGGLLVIDQISFDDFAVTALAALQLGAAAEAEGVRYGRCAGRDRLRGRCQHTGYRV